MINYLKNRMLLVFKDEKGQGMVEYALIIGFVAIAVIVVLGFLGTSISDKFQEIINAL